MIQVHANTYRNIVKKAGQEMTGFGWKNKSDRYRSYHADFEFVSENIDWRNRRKELKDGYVRFTGNRDKKREAEALFRLWLLENGYKYELVMETRILDYYVADSSQPNGRRRATEVVVAGIKITYIPAQTERSAS